MLTLVVMMSSPTSSKEQFCSEILKKNFYVVRATCTVKIAAFRELSWQRWTQRLQTRS